jgi:Ca2+:H+ antiporter
MGSFSWGALLKPSLNWLLVFVPLALLVRYVPALRNETALFFISCLGIIPLAGLMGSATGQLADRVGQGVGGLLNATFGNAAELIIGLAALHKGLTGVVKASLTGSVIGNVLLVLGFSFVSGGLKFPVQRFNRTAAGISATALSLAAIALVIPTVFHQVAAGVPPAQGGWTSVKENHLSIAIAVVLLLTYVLTLVFSLGTHRKMFADEAQDDVKAVTPALAGGGAGDETWSVRRAVATLAVATAFVAVLSESLAGAVEQARAALGLSEVFVGVIVVAIVGNAAEHSTAVMMALRDKMDVTLGITLGSGLQIALFVAPVLVFASHLFGHPMTLEFSVPEVLAVVASIIIVEQISSDGESNWMEGVQLLSVYAILAVLFYFLPDVPHVTK